MNGHEKQVIIVVPPGHELVVFWQGPDFQATKQQTFKAPEPIQGQRCGDD